MKRATAMVPLAAVIIAAGAAPFLHCGPEQPRTHRPDIIFISVDALRADHLGCYGYDRETSPHIDTFAGESLLFENYYVTMTATLPSHTSMFTGLHPRTHGMIKNGLVLDDDLETLPELLREAGYRTTGIVAAYPLSSETNFDQGFDDYTDLYSGDGKIGSTADQVLDAAAPFLRAHGDDPFFLFLHIWDVHKPYRPPHAFVREERRKKIALYDGGIRYVDSVLGRLYDLLREEGLYRESLIIFAADHGEALGEHGYTGHGKTLEESALRAPLIIHFPRDLGPPPGRASWLTSGVDLFPTLLNLLGLESGVPVDGMDMLGEAVRQREFVFAQRRHYNRQEDPEMRPVKPNEPFEYGDKYAIRSLRSKYVLRTRGEDEFFDLSADPRERVNLLSSGARPLPEAARLRGLLLEWVDRGGRRYKADLRVPSAVRERLRALGYTD